jgi:hypothetical protein
MAKDRLPIPPRRHEGSARDVAEDKRNAKRAGMSVKDYEKTAEDRAEDAAGEKPMRKHKGKGKVAVKPHFRGPRGSLPPKTPAPGPNEFSPDQEQAMRAGAANARMSPMPAGSMGGGGPPDDLDLDGM